MTDYRIRKTLESKSNMEEDKTASLEAQLGQAKQIAEEADKKYDEVCSFDGKLIGALWIITQPSKYC